MSYVYEPPSFLLERYQDLHRDRFKIREQFRKIVLLIEEDIQLLQTQRDPQDQDLIEEMKAFRVWSWRDVDRDEGFYHQVMDFDRRTKTRTAGV